MGVRVMLLGGGPWFLVIYSGHEIEEATISSSRGFRAVLHYLGLTAPLKDFLALCLFAEHHSL